MARMKEWMSEWESARIERGSVAFLPIRSHWSGSKGTSVYHIEGARSSNQIAPTKLYQKTCQSTIDDWLIAIDLSTDWSIDLRGSSTCAWACLDSPWNRIVYETNAFMYLYIYAFIHLCIYTFLHLYIFAFMHLYIYAFIHLYIYAWMHKCIHACVEIETNSRASPALWRMLRSFAVVCCCKWQCAGIGQGSFQISRNSCRCSPRCSRGHAQCQSREPQTPSGG